MIGCFGEIVVDIFPDKKVVGGAPLNVAVHLRRLGVEVELVSAIGDDANGILVDQLLIQEGLSDKVLIDKNKSTGVAAITMGEEGHSFAISRGCAWEYITAPLTSTYVILVFGSLAMMSDHNRAQFDQLRTKSRLTRCFLDLNLRPDLYNRESIEWCLERATFLKISDEEAYVLGELFEVGTDLDTIIQWIKIEWNLEEVYCTCGSKGSISIIDEIKFSYDAKPIPSLNIVDTVGAGDAFSAALLNSMYFGIDRTDIIPRAHTFASYICTHAGAIPNNVEGYSIISQDLQ